MIPSLPHPQPWQSFEEELVSDPGSLAQQVTTLTTRQWLLLLIKIDISLRNGKAVSLDSNFSKLVLGIKQTKHYIVNWRQRH